MEFCYGIKVHPDSLNIKALSMIHKQLNIAIGEARRRVAADEHLATYDPTDLTELANLIVLYRDLESAGADPIVFDDDEPIDIDEVVTDLKSQREDVVDADEVALVEDELWWNLDLG